MSMSEELAPTLFVAMPFGRKADPSKSRQIDFDQVWRRAISPACADAGIEGIRADEDRGGGFVHLSMYERLLLSDFVIADLTLASSNVFYELGIRHAARPRSTILIAASTGGLPFDVATFRVLPYRLKKNGELSQKAAEELRLELGSLLTQRLHDVEAVDSPLFQLIGSYPGVALSHDATDIFQNRARAMAAKSQTIREAGRRLPIGSGVNDLERIAVDVLEHQVSEEDLLVDLVLAHRDAEDWTGLVALVERMPDALSKSALVTQQHGPPPQVRLPERHDRRSGRGPPEAGHSCLSQGLRSRSTRLLPRNQCRHVVLGAWAQARPAEDVGTHGCVDSRGRPARGSAVPRLLGRRHCPGDVAFAAIDENRATGGRTRTGS